MRHTLLFTLLILLLLPSAAHAQKAAPLREGRIAFNGGTLAYAEAGQGKPVVFLHAGFQDRSMWVRQMQLQRYFRLILVDLPGHGATADGPRRANADSIVLTLLDSLHIDHASIVSLSFGSAVALEFASRHPERVEKLVMAGPAVEGWSEIQTVLPQTMKTFTDLMAALEAKDTAKAALGFVKNWYAGPLRRLNELPEPLFNYGYTTTLHNMRAHKASGWPEFEAPTTVHRVAALNVPVLLLLGAKDMPEVLRVGDWLKKTLPHTQLITFRSAAHMVNMEQPLIFNKAVLEFLQKP
ncbi:MAG: alpha/beta hydrolase [Sphingobacteriales bacterium]|nr:MAG: alpha/beta hydrolase [Sphingobacteriales bacterium]